MSKAFLLGLLVAASSLAASLMVVLSMAGWAIGQRAPLLDGFCHMISAHFRD